MLQRKSAAAVLALLVLVGVVAGWQPIPREILQRNRTWVTDFGAIPNDGLDDTAAIIACRKAAIANGTYVVHFPGGVWDIDSHNVLHPLREADGSYADESTRPPFGISFTGAAQSYSILRLHRSPGNERWLYDSGSAATTVNPGWSKATFDRLWFQTNQPGGLAAPWDASYAAEVNGFRIGGDLRGVDKGFIFRCCQFRNLGTPHAFSGTAQTDSLNASSCWYVRCGPIIFENDQAILCNWQDCHFYYPEDCIWIKNTTGEGIQGKGGAGNTYFSRCDIIHEADGPRITAIANNGSGLIRVTAAGHGYNTNDWVVISSAPSATGANNRWQVTKIDDNTVDLQGSTFAATASSGIMAEGDTPYYTVRIDDGAAFARSLVFQGGQWELRQTWKSRLVHKRGNSSLTFTNQVLFEGCNLSVNQGAESGANGREFLTLGGYTNVCFNDCAINERFGVGFYDVNTSSVTSGQYQPLVEMNGCMLGGSFVENLATRVTYDTGGTNTGGYGRVISRNGRALTSSTLSGNAQLDFDYGKSRAGRGEPPKERRWVPLKAGHQNWPTTSGGVGSGERTVLLVPGAKIWAVQFDRPASGSSSTITNYRVGSNDKSITYCASTNRADGRHIGRADHTTDPSLFPIEVGTDANLRTVRLWQGPVENALTTSGGEVMVLVE